MSTGSTSAYFDARPEWREAQVGWDAVRNRAGCSLAPAAAPLWTAPHHESTSAQRMIETESMYARQPYAGGSPVQRSHASAGPPILQSLQRTQSVNEHLHATAVPFPEHTGRPPRVCQVSDGTVHALDRSSLGWYPLGASPDPRHEPPSLGNASAPRLEVMDAPALHFTPSNQVWEEAITTAFASPHRPPQARSWDPSNPPHIQPPSAVEPTPAQMQDAENEHDVHTSATVCEWTDEHGTCNMDVVGDRVWMSHHLSRRHNVVGHERSQRACLWRGCADTMNKGSLARHVVSRHLRAGTSCGFCSKVYSRADVARRHTKKCKAATEAPVQQDHTK